MKRLLTIAGIIAVFVLASFQAATATEHKVITGPELDKMMKDGSPITIVDVREPDLFSAGHIPGAINIPFGTPEDTYLKRFSPKDRVVFVCHGGPMGDKLGRFLSGKGYGSIYNLKGGMNWGWNGPLQKGSK